MPHPHCPKHRTHTPKRPSLPFQLLFALTGIGSLLWLLLRSGFKPSRLRYPCQQAALSALLASLSYWAGLVGLTLLIARTRNQARTLWLSRLTQPWKRSLFAALGASLAVAVLLVFMVVGQTPRQVRAADPLEVPSWTSPSAISDVFVVTDVPVPAYSLDEGTLPSGVDPEEVFRDAGIDSLIDLMALHNTPFYRTSSSPAGLFGSSDVIVIKVNTQWSNGWTQRYNHTRIDLVKGLIHRLVSHPEGFTGAVILGENTQSIRPGFDNEEYQNAEDPSTSYQDVVDAFVSQGHAVGTSSWDDLNDHFVADFSSADMRDGYVTGAAPGGQGSHELSWPKFSLDVGGTTYRISMKEGLWNGASYEPDRLKMINFPVLKAHGMAGATLALKNYIGFLTIGNNDPLFSNWVEMHGYFWGYADYHRGYGLLARQIANVRRADLDILDGIWVNPVSNTDDSDSCVRENLVLASRDPVALDYYASARILSQIAPYPEEVNAASHEGTFRKFMLCLENRLRAEGVANVIDLDDSYTQQQEEAQFNVYVANAAGGNDDPTPTVTPLPDPTATPSPSETVTPTETETEYAENAPTAANPEADLSGDQWIDVRDLMILLENWHHQVVD